MRAYKFRSPHVCVCMLWHTTDNSAIGVPNSHTENEKEPKKKMPTRTANGGFTARAFGFTDVVFFSFCNLIMFHVGRECQTMRWGCVTLCSGFYACTIRGVWAFIIAYLVTFTLCRTHMRIARSSDDILLPLPWGINYSLRPWMQEYPRPKFSHLHKSSIKKWCK